MHVYERCPEAGRDYCDQHHVGMLQATTEDARRGEFVYLSSFQNRADKVVTVLDSDPYTQRCQALGCMS